MDYTRKVEDKINEYLKESGVTIQEILGNTDALVFWRSCQRLYCRESH
jgi:hypothetical protein